MTRCGHFLLFLIILCISAPSFAQAAPDPKIQELEQKLDDLLRQAASLRQELDALKGAQPAPAEPQDLTAVEVVPSAPAPTAQPAPTPAPVAAAEAPGAL